MNGPGHVNFREPPPQKKLPRVRGEANKLCRGDGSLSSLEFPNKRRIVITEPNEKKSQTVWPSNKMLRVAALLDEEIRGCEEIDY